MIAVSFLHYVFRCAHLSPPNSWMALFSYVLIFSHVYIVYNTLAKES
jgi:hypothetical protein